MYLAIFSKDIFLIAILLPSHSGDYDGALLLFTEMASKALNYGPQPPSGVYADIMHRLVSFKF